jgi:hypothetical protein
MPQAIKLVTHQEGNSFDIQGFQWVVQEKNKKFEKKKLKKVLTATK